RKRFLRLSNHRRDLTVPPMSLRMAKVIGSSSCRTMRQADAKRIPGGSHGFKVELLNSIKAGDMSKILVIGSSNTDLIAKVDRLPSAGETIQGSFFLQAMGGKGANQALAAHRLGGDVKFVTCLGDDANGQNTLRYYEEEGLD